MQQQFGKNEADLETLVDGFCWILGDYDTSLVFNGFREYLSNNNNIPTPADIIQIINPRPKPKPKRNWSSTAFIDIKRRSREGQFITDAEKQYCEDFIAAQISEPENTEIAKAIKTAELESKKYWSEE